MAKLKIPKPDATKPDGFDHDMPNVDGYVNVVDSLLVQATYKDFLDADEDDRPEKLQSYASKGGTVPSCVVFHEVVASPKNEFKSIDNDNCAIRVEKDKRKRKNKNKASRFRISFPEGNKLDPPGYLDRYALEIFGLYAKGYGVKLPDPLVVKDQNALDKAHKFMFGMMLLTRCR
jgi:hypothetical protein